MKSPSRKTITATIFFVFIFIFFGALAWYFGGAFFGQNTDTEFVDTDKSRGFTFFPFGRGGGEPTIVVPNVEDPNEVDNENPNTGGEVVVAPQIDRLRLIAEVPVAGGYVYRRSVENTSLFDTTPQTEVAMRYVEIESGHVYETKEDTAVTTRITNTTIPRIAEADFIDGDSLAVRYIDPTSQALKTFIAKISEKSTNDKEDDAQRLQKLNGVFLPDDISDVTVNDASQILYTQRTSDGLIAVVTDTFGQNRKQIFSSPLREWKPDWQRRTNTITMTTYPSAISYGLSQILDEATQKLTPFVSGLQGLDVLMSPDGNTTLVSYKTGNTISLFIRQADGDLVDTGLDTYAEKCVWSGDSVLVYCAEPINTISDNAPDTWYQGLESYSDDVWRINTSDVTKRILFSPFDEGFYSLDIIDLQISADERYLSFRDKENSYFWTYQLEL